LAYGIGIRAVADRKGFERGADAQGNVLDRAVNKTAPMVRGSEP
jgi:hypothetical protein